MSLDNEHIDQMNKLDELIKAQKEGKLTKFLELIVASIVGVVASKLWDAIYSTPTIGVEDNVTKGFIFVILLVAVTALLYFCAYWTDILHGIHYRKRKSACADVLRQV